MIQRAILKRALAKRGLALSAEQFARVDACADVTQLDKWFDRALTAQAAVELFDA